MNWWKRVNRGLLLFALCALAVIVYYIVIAVIAIPDTAQTETLVADYMEIYSRHSLLPEEYRNLDKEVPDNVIDKQTAAYRAEVEKLFSEHPDNNLDQIVSEMRNRLLIQSRKSAIYTTCSDYNVDSLGSLRKETVRRDFQVGYLDIQARQTRDRLSASGNTEQQKWTQTFSFLFVKEQGEYKILTVLRLDEMRTDSYNMGESDPFYYSQYSNMFPYDDYAMPDGGMEYDY